MTVSVPKSSVLLPLLTLVSAAVAILALSQPAQLPAELGFLFKPLTTVLILLHAWGRGADQPRLARWLRAGLVCSLKLSRRVFPGLASYKLGNLSQSLGIVFGGRAHRAHRARPHGTEGHDLAHGLRTQPRGPDDAVSRRRQPGAHEQPEGQQACGPAGARRSGDDGVCAHGDCSQRKFRQSLVLACRTGRGILWIGLNALGELPYWRGNALPGKGRKPAGS